MKNLFKLAILVVGFVIVGQYNSEKKTPQVSSLIFQNIEALADGNESDPVIICVGKGSIDCPYLVEKVEYVASGYGL